MRVECMRLYGEGVSGEHLENLSYEFFFRHVYHFPSVGPVDEFSYQARICPRNIPFQATTGVFKNTFSEVAMICPRGAYFQ